MPIAEDDLSDVRRRVLQMFMDTVATFEAIEKNADAMYGDRASDVRAAINECLDDFVRRTHTSGERHPEALVYEAPSANYQRAGFYGVQLQVKEHQVTNANRTLREQIVSGVRGLWNRPFKRWVDVINNFLGSFSVATGLSEAIKELKDCLRDELPDDE